MVSGFRITVPKYRKHAKNRILEELNLPTNATFEQADEKLFHFIVCARRVDDLKSAAQLSEAREYLKKRLKHKCSDCQESIHPKSSKCKRCTSFQKRSLKGYGSSATSAGITKLVEHIVRSVRKPFFKDELCWLVEHSQQNKGWTHKQIHMSVSGALRYMLRKKLITGGGMTNWQRFELVPTDVL